MSILKWEGNMPHATFFIEYTYEHSQRAYTHKHTQRAYTHEDTQKIYAQWVYLWVYAHLSTFMSAIS